ncbi:hypothetical protein ACFO3O_19215 [Dokdonia ponticola]|uniref:Uncharacterized protein n=1 Tax=Dokdonia ponticola TaxID=2041041 RepID=A0ABV9I2J1_9FLAO
MKKATILLVYILCILPSFGQETKTEKNPRNNIRQGFGTHNSFDLGLGFVNPDFKTDGSAYYFEDWETEGVIFTKQNGSFKIKNVNINLYKNTLDALYDENSVYTFDSDNLLKIEINDKIFRVFTIDGEKKIFELFFNEALSVYREYSVLYSEASINPMHARSVNKYIKKEKYYLYTDGELTRMKTSKKAFAKLVQSDDLSQKAIVDYISKNRLSLNDETDLLQVLNFVNK